MLTGILNDAPQGHTMQQRCVWTACAVLLRACEELASELLSP